MIKFVLAALGVAAFGGDFEKSNVKSGDRNTTVTQWENKLLQIRETQPRDGSPPGLRISLRASALSDLAKEDHGFAKLVFHLQMRDALVAAAPPGVVINFSDAPQGRSSGGYPVVYVNRERVAQIDTTSIVNEAVEAGVAKDEILACIQSGDYTKLRSLTALATAISVPEDEMDSDGDGLPI